MVIEQDTVEWRHPDLTETEVLPRARGRHKLSDGITSIGSMVYALCLGLGVVLAFGLLWLVNPFHTHIVPTLPSPTPVTRTTIPAVFLPVGTFSPTPTPTPTLTHRHVVTHPTPPAPTPPPPVHHPVPHPSHS